MLNMLVRKHPTVAAVYPLDVRDALRRGLFTPGQFDWVFLDAAVALTDDERDQVERIARRATVVVGQGEWQVIPSL